MKRMLFKAFEIYTSKFNTITIMNQKNEILRGAKSKRQLRRDIRAKRTQNTAQELFDRIRDQLPIEKNAALTRAFEKRVKEITNCTALVKNVRHEAQRRDLSRCLDRLHDQRWDNLDRKTRAKFCRRVNHRMRIYKKWQNIVNNLTAPHIRFVDVRCLTFADLAQAHKPEWVQDKEESLDPEFEQEEPPAIEKKFTPEQIEEIANHINTTTIINDVGSDPKQIDLICRDLCKELKRRAR